MEDMMSNEQAPGRALRSVWEFDCNNSVDGENLCFNSGRCIQEVCTEGQSDCRGSYCVCPEGFTNDMDWFHLLNCARPVNSTRDFLIVYTFIFLILSGWYLVSAHKTLRRAARRIGILTFGTLIGHFSLVLSVYLQNGCFEACAVASLMDFPLCAIAIRETIMLAVVPVLSLQQRSIRRYMLASRIWTILCCLGFVGSGIAMMIFCRQQPTGNYNKAAFAMGATLWTCGFTNMTAVAKAIWNLRSQLVFSERISKKQYRGVKLRLWVLQISAANILIPFFVLLLVTPILFSYFRSFPYYFVFFYAQLIFGTLNFTGAVLFFIKPRVYAEYQEAIEIAAGSRKPPQNTHAHLVGFETDDGHSKQGGRFSARISRKFRNMPIDGEGSEREQTADFRDLIKTVGNVRSDRPNEFHVDRDDEEKASMKSLDYPSVRRSSEFTEEGKNKHASSHQPGQSGGSESTERGGNAWMIPHSDRDGPEEELRVDDIQSNPPLKSSLPDSDVTKSAAWSLPASSPISITLIAHPGSANEYSQITPAQTPSVPEESRSSTPSDEQRIGNLISQDVLGQRNKHSDDL